ncbi:hypothetical protein OH77DRAFT_1438977 [Trametes cingulata]|nr:hypothetical protein OH77DRAFT_1438977 [Trametes cingulata]
MSLDQNLFTLNVNPRTDDRNALDLIDPNGVVHYTKRRLPGTEYTIEMIDPLSGSVLATVTAPSPTSKHKTLQLYNPDIVVELKYTGTITFRWAFKWEEPRIWEALPVVKNIWSFVPGAYGNTTSPSSRVHPHEADHGRAYGSIGACTDAELTMALFLTLDYRHDFEWKREECYILRKPDPAVLVAITKEPPGRLQTRSVQILDYNLNRFEINDRKGLEIVILTALLTFQDLNETYHSPQAGTSPSGSPSESSTTLVPAAATGLASRLGLSRQPSQLLSTPPPAVPPKPAPRTGVDRVAEIHAVRAAQGEGDANEIEVGEECTVDDYALYAERLLNDEAMLFITVPKVLRVVEETKRLRHKSGVAEDEELHQYVIYDTHQGSPKSKGPKRINLDDPDPKSKGKDKAKYAPPTSLTVHLSKIDMPELQPKVSPGNMRRPSGSGPAVGAGSAPAPVPEMSDKERRKAEKESKKAEKESKKGGKDGKKSGKKDKDAAPTPAHGKLTKPASGPSSPGAPPLPDRPPHAPPNSFLGYHVPPHQTHPYQPSPSPSQLNNPMIYTAPPPPPAHASASAPMSVTFPAPSFYGSAAGSGFNAMPSPSPSPNPRPGGGGYRPGYVGASEHARPASYHPPSSSSSGGKGPVTALLEMWSKH